MKEPIQQMVQNPETSSAGTKMGVGLAGGALSAITLNEWVAIATLVYLVLQIGLLAPSYIKIYKKWRDNAKS
jgi:hypothetical protein